MGKNHSIYFSEQMEHLAQDLLDQHVSFSDVITSAIKAYACMKKVKLVISEGAYVCLSDGRFDLLNAFRLEDGSMILTMKEEAYRMQDGKPGPYADAKDELLKYINP